MANVDSISFALLIPFGVCFLLIFLVCCFAEEIKEMCRMPSQLPRNYIAVDSQQRHNRRRRRHSSRLSTADDNADLIQSEEGRSRNVSESSVESRGDVRNYHDRLMRTHLPSLMVQQGLVLCPQTSVPRDHNGPIASQVTLHNVLLTSDSINSRKEEQITPRDGNPSSLRMESEKTKREALNAPCVIVNKDNSSPLTNTVSLISKSDMSPMQSERL